LRDDSSDAPEYVAVSCSSDSCAVAQIVTKKKLAADQFLIFNGCGLTVLEREE
jgi:hypothetical protein